MPLMPSPPKGIPPSPSVVTDLSTLEEGIGQESGVNTDASTSPSIVQKVTAEIVGTFILVFIGCGSGYIDATYHLTIVGVALTWGLAIMVVIYSLGHISGAHVNPAVTIALIASRKFPWQHAPAYIASQVLGSTLASLALRALFRHHDPRPSLTMPSAHTNYLDALVWEFIVSFVLMFAICGTATDHRAKNEFTGVAVGGVIAFDALVAGPVTGASMNPARSVGPALVARRYDGLWIYMIAPVLGAVTAAILYGFLQSPPDKSEKQVVKTV